MELADEKINKNIIIKKKKCENNLIIMVQGKGHLKKWKENEKFNYGANGKVKLRWKKNFISVAFDLNEGKVGKEK